MEWISVKDKTPPFCKSMEGPFLLAYHTVYGIGMAWFYYLEDWDWDEDTLEIYGQYICSADFVRDKVDGNWSINSENIDVFKNSPIFQNLGTITHWMPIPQPPKGD